jgi:hypothetical protein
LHQHTPLTEIFQLPQWRLEALRQEYCKYQAHVAHAEYSGQQEQGIREGIAAAESTWPEHAHDAVMAELPAYQTRRAQTATDLAEAEVWRQEYLERDVVALQYLKQHHYHPISAETGERVPLRGCQKKENMGVALQRWEGAVSVPAPTAWLCASRAQKSAGGHTWSIWAPVLESVPSSTLGWNARRK